jgi:hypothetical protein
MPKETSAHGCVRLADGRTLEYEARWSLPGSRMMWRAAVSVAGEVVATPCGLWTDYPGDETPEIVVRRLVEASIVARH